MDSLELPRQVISFFDNWPILFLWLIGFLLVREIFTWYWKQNRIVNLLEKIEENTRKPGAEKEAETPVRKGPFS